MRAFVNSIPKSGTNLLEKLVARCGLSRSGRSIALSSVLGPFAPVRQILRSGAGPNAVPVGLESQACVRPGWLRRYVESTRDGQYLSGHAPFSSLLYETLIDNGVRTIQIYRDPRSVLVSWADFSVTPELRWYPFQPYLRSLTFAERIHFFLDGGKVDGLGEYAPFAHVLMKTEGWMTSPDVLAIRFEDLVGSEGGGDIELQEKTIRSVLRFLDMDAENDLEGAISQGLYGGTKTFRRGRIDGWRDEISDSLAREIVAKSRCAVTDRMGYFT